MITSTDNSMSNCKDDQGYIFEEDSWSSIFEETSVGYDDKKDKKIFEGNILPYLHSDGSCKQTPKHPYNIVWFPEELRLIFHISDFTKV